MAMQLSRRGSAVWAERRRVGASWTDSPQGADPSIATMHVLLPECNAWLKLDVRRVSSGTATTFSESAGFRVKVSNVVDALAERVSVFKDAEAISIYKCSAETPRGDPLDHTSDTVYYLTWLIAWTNQYDGNHLLYDNPSDVIIIDERVSWQTYVPPADTANLKKVLIYIEQCDVWEAIYVPDKGVCTNGRFFTKIVDLKAIVLSNITATLQNGVDVPLIEDQKDLLEVRFATGSSPQGEELPDTHKVFGNTWYYVTAYNMQSLLDQLEAGLDNEQ